jgi:hypothetical protein
VAYQAQFEQIWADLRRELASPQVIRNWTRDSGYLGQNFTAQQAGDHVLCVLPAGKELRVPKGDFEVVYELWPGYLAGQIRRVDVREVTYYSKYVISILHQFLGEAG